MKSTADEPGRSSQAPLLSRYWDSNLRIMLGLLAVWALTGLSAGILVADWLNQFSFPGTGFPLGFWFAHQGSILSFVVLILLYCLLMNRLDRKHHAEMERMKREVEQ
jgi:putative solute:sodium symporter small subunit